MSTEKKTSSRQQAGLACEACRARKLRCDRGRPSCGTCKELGIVCIPNTSRQPRGPRKGQITALQSRLEAVEQRLLVGGTVTDAVNDAVLESSIDTTAFQTFDSNLTSLTFDPALYLDQDLSNLPTPPWTTHGMADLGNTSRETIFDDHACETITPSRLCDSWPPRPLPATQIDHTSLFSAASSDSGYHGRSDSIDLSTQPQSLVGSPTPSIFDIMTNALDQLYFSQTHPCVPFLNEQRFKARLANGCNGASSLTCLRHAMWTLAAVVSPQFHSMRHSMYAHTRAMLEQVEQGMKCDSIAIEHAQAWLLLALYELTQISCQRGSISAGRCIRLVHLMKLHEVDHPQAEKPADVSWVELEERRRTFWVASSLDECINMVNSLPLTLGKQTILTRLPAHEALFQTGQAMQTSFATQEVTGRMDPQASAFSEFLVLLTLGGSCISQQHSSGADPNTGHKTFQSVVSRHQCVSAALTQKIDMLRSNLDNDDSADAMSVFALMTAYATVTLLRQSLQPMEHAMGACQGLLDKAERNAVIAVQQTIDSLRRTANGCSVTHHPLTPVPVYFCARFAQQRRDQEPQLQQLTDYLTRSAATNQLAQACLSRLNLDTDMEN